jgi:hypothetical protein
MVVDFLRCQTTDLETLGFALPEFDEPGDSDPALEQYDYIFLNDFELSNMERGPPVRSASMRIPRSTEFRRVPRSPPPPPPRRPRLGPSKSNGWGWGMGIHENDRLTTGEREKPIFNSQKEASLGTTQMTEHQLLLMPYRVPAFSTNTKKWCRCLFGRFEATD